MENKNIIYPVYELLVNDENEQGIFKISLVEDPAIQVDWVTFKAIPEAVTFKTVSTEKRIVMSPLLIPDQYIYRGDKYYTISKENIEKSLKNFLKRSSDINKFNINHTEGQTIEGVYLFEIWIADTVDKSHLYFDKELIKPGSLMVSLFIQSEQVWNEYIKTGKIKAFSQEGFFSKSVNPVDFVSTNENERPPLTVNNSVFNSPEEKLINEIITVLKQD